MFNYCWWKGHFVGRTSESGISESDLLVLGCLTKSACNPLENFTILAFPDHWLSTEQMMAHSAGKKKMSTYVSRKCDQSNIHQITCVSIFFKWEIVEKCDSSLTCLPLPLYLLCCSVFIGCWCQKATSFNTQSLDTLKSNDENTLPTIYAQLHLGILYEEAMKQCKLFHCADYY